DPPDRAALGVGAAAGRPRRRGPRPLGGLLDGLARPGPGGGRRGGALAGRRGRHRDAPRLPHPSPRRPRPRRRPAPPPPPPRPRPPRPRPARRRRAAAPPPPPRRAAVAPSSRAPSTAAERSSAVAWSSSSTVLSSWWSWSWSSSPPGGRADPPTGPPQARPSRAPTAPRPRPPQPAGGVGWPATPGPPLIVCGRASSSPGRPPAAVMVPTLRGATVGRPAARREPPPPGVRSPLVDGAAQRRPPADPAPHDRGAVAGAEPVERRRLPQVAGVAAAPGAEVGQHLPDGGVEGVDLAVREAAGRPGGVEPGPEEDLVGQQVPDAGQA